jgi:DNA modification methylase
MKPSPKPKLNSSVNPGDIFALGEHRLLCGDARDADAILRLLGKERISTILVDPPYGVAYVESKAGFKQKLGKEKIIANDHEQSEDEYRIFTKDWTLAVRPLLTRHNSFYAFNADKMIFALRDGMKDAGYVFTQLLIWAKTQAVVGRMDYLPQHELIAYGWYGRHQFHKSKDKSILVYPKPSSSKLHPTMKPVGLLRRLVLNSTNTGDIVYDCFGGSGSTLIACEDTRRRCYMVELDPEYCQTIIDRFEKHTGIKVKKL